MTREALIAVALLVTIPFCGPAAAVPMPKPKPPAGDKLPNSLIGDWCWVSGGKTPRQLQIFKRVSNCKGGDNLVRVDQTGAYGEGSCVHDKITKKARGVYLIHGRCEDYDGRFDEPARAIVKIIGRKMIVRGTR
jgi:hypothetical protein